MRKLLKPFNDLSTDDITSMKDNSKSSKLRKFAICQILTYETQGKTLYSLQLWYLILNIKENNRIAYNCL